jgi:hypothetical protein
MRQVVTLAVLVLALAGCVFPTVREANPDWPESVHVAIEQGQLLKGMTYDQAGCVLGRIESYTEYSNGMCSALYVLSRWQSQYGGYNRIAESATLIYRNGRLVSWSFSKW